MQWRVAGLREKDARNEEGTIEVKEWESVFVCWWFIYKLNEMNFWLIQLKLHFISYVEIDHWCTRTFVIFCTKLIGYLALGEKNHLPAEMAQAHTHTNTHKRQWLLFFSGKWCVRCLTHINDSSCDHILNQTIYLSVIVGDFDRTKDARSFR